MILYTHHNDMVAPQYEWLYDASDLFQRQTICYKHYIYMDACILNSSSSLTEP